MASPITTGTTCWLVRLTLRMVRALALFAALASAEGPEKAGPIHFWVRNETAAPICEVVVRFQAREARLATCVRSEEAVIRFGEMPRQLEWRDSGGFCHLQDLTVPLCSVCNKTWHIGDTAIVTDTGLRYKCE